jgi:ATP-dependent exoDNAse (exonuclease V) alpha subunit
LAERLDARILLTGDRFQHGSIERGAALRLLEEEAGIVPATVKEIRRQQGEYKAAVKALSAGRVAEAFSMLDRMGWIREIPDDERYMALAADYVGTVQDGKTALVVSPTHYEGSNCTREIRHMLNERGILKGEEREFETLVNAQFTEAEKTYLGNYHEGDLIQFHQNAKGFVKGQRLNVGEQKLPLDQSHRYTVFRRGVLNLATGDVIRITHNGRTADGKHRLDNGAVFTVKDFDNDGNIVLANGWTVARDFGHLTHGYVVTSYGSQGRTVDRVFIGQGSDSYGASSKEQFYVSCSRGRKSATIYSDDKAALLDAVLQSDERLTATEFAGRDRRRERLRRFERLNGERESLAREQPRELVHER